MREKVEGRGVRRMGERAQIINTWMKEEFHIWIYKPIGEELTLKQNIFFVSINVALFSSLIYLNKHSKFSLDIFIILFVDILFLFVADVYKYNWFCMLVLKAALLLNSLILRIWHRFKFFLCVTQCNVCVSWASASSWTLCYWSAMR